jgi:hypothetical protein
MLRALGVLFNLAGVAGFWFGGVPYTTREPILSIGPIKTEAEVERKFVIPPPVSAGAVGSGTLLLLVSGLRKR